MHFTHFSSVVKKFVNVYVKFLQDSAYLKLQKIILTELVKG